METVKIKQSTKRGFIDCAGAYPFSKTRRGRAQENGWIYPTITATETGIYRIERDDSYEHRIEKPP